MKNKWKSTLYFGSILVVLFVIWTVLIQIVDVQPLGQKGTEIGFATINTAFHQFTGEHLELYDLTDKLSAIPFLVCIIFGLLGFVQLVKRKHLLKVDPDIIALGIYYIIVIGFFVFFQIVPINYRPVLFEGNLEASFPSSTTLLVLSVMPTLIIQVNSRIKNKGIKILVAICTVVFLLFMVVARVVSGVHWATDIIGALLLSMGLFCIYHAVFYRLKTLYKPKHLR